jgi:SPP1 gp7 family putative phage head morphogenesis protein
MRVMATRDWQVSQQIEMRYLRALKDIKLIIQAQVKKAGDVADVQIILNNMHKYKAFTDLAEVMAEKMVTMVDEVNEKTWREASMKQGKGRLIYDRLQQTMSFHSNVGQAVRQKSNENANLIKTLPSYVARDVNKFIGTEAFKGLRSSDIAKVLQGKIAEYSDARAGLIARTETSKAMTALTEARSKDIGAKWYIWRTANDGQRVRPSHRLMKDVICSYDDPPSPEQLNGEKSAGRYNAGNIYNCRCFPRPLLSLSSIQFPAKVYYNGRIQMMTKAQFASIAQVPDLTEVKPITKIKKKVQLTPSEAQVEAYRRGREILHEDDWYESAFKGMDDRQIKRLIRDSIKEAAGSGAQDFIQAAMFRHQGFDELPEVLEEHEYKQVVNSGCKPIYRGVGGSRENRKYVDQFKTGNLYYGKGIYGNGTYTGADLRTAQGYADYNDDNILHMAIRKDANIVTHRDITRKQRKIMEELNERERTPKVKNLLEILDDEGKLATLLGYDAIHVEQSDYFVVLNRTALYVKK